MSLYTDASIITTPNGFKAGKLYSVKPTDGTGDLDVVRATTATRVNSAGLIETVGVNVPRLDYSNGSCPSILVEPQRTNLITYSEEFDSGDWVKSNVSVTANTITSPDGTSSADFIIPSAVSQIHQIYNTSGTATSGTYTLSVFAKKGFYKNLLVWFDNHSGGVGVNLDTLAIFSDQNNDGYKIEDYGNGWVRISVVATVSISFFPGFYIYDNSATPQLIYSANGTDGLYLWGAQVEAGSYPTSYIPTVASTVTRNADVISKTGISSLIGVNVGTFYFQSGFVQTSGIGQPVWNELKSINGSIFCYDDSVFHSIGGGFNFISNISPFDKVAIIWNGLNITTYQNGLLVSTIAQSAIFNPNEYFLGTNYSLLSIIKNKGIQIYKTALTDAECIALTTL